MDSLPINMLDIIILVVLGISGLLAFMRGLVHEVLRIGAWIGAGFITLYSYLPARDLSRQFIKIELAADIAAGVALFLISLILLSLFSRNLSKRVQDSSLGALDRSLGLLFGLLRGVVLISVTWTLFNWLMPPKDQPDWVQSARALPLVKFSARTLMELVPQNIRQNSEILADDALQEGRKAAKTGATIHDLLQPAPSAGPSGGRSSSDGEYTNDQRQDMNRLFEAQQ